MLSYVEKHYLKHYLKRIFCFLLVLFCLGYLVYSCDLDFAFRERNLPNNTVTYHNGIIKKPLPKQEVLYFKKELKLELAENIQITGNFLVVADGVLRTNCPFQKENVDLYNKYFHAVVISVDNQYHQFSVMSESRLIRQLLSKLSNNTSFQRSKYGHKITMIGYLLKLPQYSDSPFENVVVTKIILDNKVYE